ncbi:M57 family metalloprotease [Aquimarina agarilytica]|uniref:M57 family metalloprotease n=1 Tax=Aquimarina agarilytica TaxID=1087449 RepID=UPI0002882DB2|nr:M57 family metalloprotease [Aquimarina agarilytica]
MKSFKKQIRFVMPAAVLFSVLFTSCENETEISEAEPQPQAQAQSKFSNDISAQLTNHLFDPAETELVTFTLPDGTTQKSYVYKDKAIDQSSIENTETIVDQDLAKAWQGLDLAPGNRTYTVAFVDFNQQFQRQAAGDMVWAFNNRIRASVKLRHIFIRPDQWGATRADIFVFYVNQSSLPADNIIAIADFPNIDRTRAGRTIMINAQRVGNFSNRNSLATLLKHEVLHNFGIRHNDWRTLRSCGEMRNSRNGGGLIHIPGTNNSGDFTNSIMTTCGFGTSGYSDDDIRGMRNLYGFQ